MKKKYMETAKNNSYAELGTETVSPKQEQNSRFYTRYDLALIERVIRN